MEIAHQNADVRATMARMSTVDDLARDLTALGVASGDVVMVHASMRRIGPVEGGAAAVVAAVESVIGPDGTMLMMLDARNDWAWVDERPEALRPALLADAEPFDPWRTPANPEVGVLAEVFRTLPGTIVTDCPEGRFGARGAMATALTVGAPWDDYYGPGSPLERLVRAGGKILRLGADLDTVTALHYAEYLADVPQKRRVRRYRQVAGEGGPVVRAIESLNDESGIAPWPGEDYFAVILRSYLATGRAPHGTVGFAPAELIDAADLVAYGARWMTQHLGDPARPS